MLIRDQENITYMPLHPPASVNSTTQGVH